ncbi:MAG TPA: hypothetical protein VK626_01635 [Nitrospiraceae bacterium]|nr:hypothetical protein [Nitrospiraceae bacterium]
MNRLAAFALCFLSVSSATTPPVTTPPLTLQQALARVGKVYHFDCIPHVPGTAVFDYYDALNVNPYWTVSVGLPELPFTQTVYSGGPATVYIRVTCTATSGSMPMQRVIYKFHYPDAPVAITPNAPRNITVT